LIGACVYSLSAVGRKKQRRTRQLRLELARINQRRRQVMKNFLALIGLVVILAAGIGWYCGWYQIGSAPAPDGHRRFNVDVNTDEIRNDVKKGIENVEDLINKKDGPTTTAPKVETPGVTIVLPKLEIKSGK
jgi:hypothetical protein